MLRAILGLLRQWLLQKPLPHNARRTRPRMSEDEKREHVLALNLDRRHLTREQRRELVGRLRADGWSYPRIADRLHVSLGTAHNDAHAFNSENVPDEPETVTGSDGKQYPAKRPSVVADASAPAHPPGGSAFRPRAPRCAHVRKRHPGRWSAIAARSLSARFTCTRLYLVNGVNGVNAIAETQARQWFQPFTV